MRNPFFRLKGDTLVLIDWANIFHAQRKNGWSIDLVKLYSFLKNHELISDIVFFHGTDTHKKSKLFLDMAEAVGFRIITKHVKYVPLATDHGGKPLKEPVLRRKCDFDVEISKEILLNLDRYQCFMLFSGDGDYAPIFDVLKARRKQAILVFPQGSLGREYNEVPERKRAIFLCFMELLRPYIEAKNNPKPRERPGRDCF